MIFLKGVLKRPLTIFFIIVIIFALGLYFTGQMPINLLPDLQFPYCAIKTVYVGASAKEIDETITSKIEAAVSTLPTLHSLETTSVDNGSVLILQFDYGTKNDELVTQVKERLDSVDLPSGASSPEVITVDFNGTAMATFAFYSETSDIDDVYDDAKRFKDSLSKIDGVGHVDLIGAPNKEIKIEPYNGLEIISGAIVQAIAADKELDIPIGDIYENGNKISINNHSKINSIEDLKNYSLALPVSDAYVNAFKFINDALKYIDKLSTTDLEKLHDVALDIKAIIDEIEEENNILRLKERAELMFQIEPFIPLIENNNSSSLKLLYSTLLSGFLEDETFINMTDEEIGEVAKNYNLSNELLIWLRNNGKIINISDYEYAETKHSEYVGKSYAYYKWQEIIVRDRKTKEDEMEDALNQARAQALVSGGIVNEDDYKVKYSDEDFTNLFFELGLLQNEDEAKANYYKFDDAIKIIHISRYVNSLKYNDIINKKENNINLTNMDYASLFIPTLISVASELFNNQDELLSIFSKIIDVVRDDNFEADYGKIYEFKQNHEHLEKEKNSLGVETGKFILVGDYIESEELVNLVNSLEISKKLPIKLTNELVSFFRYLSFNETKAYIKLDDVASIYLSYESDTFASFNGKRSIQVEVFGNSGSNSTSIVKECVKRQNEFKFEKANNAHIEMLYNQASFISDSLSNALISLIIGGILAIIVIYLFLFKVRSSLIISISMPLSILATLICLYLMDVTLNMVSVGGLAVGIGMLVDNSIVVLESITSEREKGLDAKEAALSGTKLVMGSLIGSTLTSICVFFPILLIKGLTREIFRDLSWAVILSLTFSLFVAIFVIPTLYAFVYKTDEVISEKRQRRIDRRKDRLDRFKNWYKRILIASLKKKGLIILSSIGIFVLSILLIFTFKIEFLPSIDQGEIQIDFKFKANDSYEYCEEKANYVYQLIVNNIDEIDKINLDVSYSGYLNTNRSCRISVYLKSKHNNTKNTLEEIRELLQDNFDLDFQIIEIDGVVATLTGGQISGVSVNIYGDDLNDLKEAVNKIEEEVLKNDGIKNVSDNLIGTSKSYSLHFDKEKINEYNLDYQTILATMRIGISGYDVSVMNLDDDEVNINISFSDNTIGGYYEDFAHFVIGYNDNYNPIYMSDVCDITLEENSSMIRKSNGKNVASISVESFGIDTNTATNLLIDSSKNVLKEYDGFYYQSSGVSYYLTDAFRGLIIALIISFVLLIIILACLFESLRKPLIIIFSFPFAFVGAFLMILITRISLNVVSFIGLIMLLGVIVNDAIILNERIDQLRLVCDDPKEGIVEGCMERIRAVFLTTLTTVLALIPMALGQGKGGALMQPLGIVAIGGLFIGAIVTLVLIPCVYAAIYRIK
ncbi:MAG: efflux RND transporter permease subunit [Bacilli bacterium]|nr:efflux RND transporter permease subunit [Bacilli bacterium]